MLHLCLQIVRKFAIGYKTMRHLNDMFHISNRISKIVVQNEYIFVNKNHIFIKTMTRHDILVNLNKVEENRHENIDAFIPRHTCKIKKRKYFPDWVTRKNCFQGCEVRRQRDMLFLNL